jgi:hypothetical protein
MSWFSRIAATFRQNKMDDDLEEELRSHREMRAQDNVNAGMNEQEAGLDARRRFGNIALIRERTRAEHLVGWLESVVQDIRLRLAHSQAVARIHDRGDPYHGLKHRRDHRHFHAGRIHSAASAPLHSGRPAHHHRHIYAV